MYQNIDVCIVTTLQKKLLPRTSRQTTNQILIVAVLDADLVDNCNNASLKSGIKQDPMLDSIERREIHVNATLSCVNHWLPNIEKGKKAGIVPSRIIGNLNFSSVNFLYYFSVCGLIFFVSPRP